MFKLFKFNEVNLRYERISLFSKFKLFIYILLITLLSFCFGYFSSIIVFEHYEYKQTDLYLKDIKHLPIGSDQWKDSLFNDYEFRAKIYLSQPKFKLSSIKAPMLRLAAYNMYEETGIVLPVELSLAQAQIESSMGTKGRSPVNNPYNIGEYDSGTVMWFNDTYDGIEAYYRFMCKNYLKCKSLDILFKSFTNCGGKRYASNPEYEVKVSSLYYSTKRYIDTEIKKIEDKKNKLKSTKPSSKVKLN